jgi:hypothetical protein
MVDAGADSRRLARGRRGHRIVRASQQARRPSDLARQAPFARPSPEYRYTVTEDDHDEPWLVLASTHGTATLKAGASLLEWARERRPAPRWIVELDPYQLPAWLRADDARSERPATPRPPIAVGSPMTLRDGKSSGSPGSLVSITPSNRWPAELLGSARSNARNSPGPTRLLVRRRRGTQAWAAALARWGPGGEVRRGETSRQVGEWRPGRVSRRAESTDVRQLLSKAIICWG